MQETFQKALLTLVALTCLATTASAASEKTLYQRLGGKKAITAGRRVCRQSGRRQPDQRLFQEHGIRPEKRLAHFKMNLVDQICEASGGPCKYKGKDMKTAHAGMGITDADFNALVEDLVGALDKFRVGAQEKNDLLGALGPMKKDIVEK
jgi:hemoglobin